MLASLRAESGSMFALIYVPSSHNMQKHNFNVIVAPSSSPRLRNTLFDIRCWLILAPSSSPRPNTTVFDMRCWFMFVPSSKSRSQNALFDIRF